MVENKGAAGVETDVNVVSGGGDGAVVVFDGVDIKVVVVVSAAVVVDGIDIKVVETEVEEKLGSVKMGIS